MMLHHESLVRDLFAECGPMLRSLLAHPSTRGLDLDDPRTTLRRGRIIREKGFLRRIYEDWYGSIEAALPPGPGAVLELGSGGGFLSEVIPSVVTSDVFCCPSVRAVLDAQAMPFVSGSLRAIVMVDVFHHLPQVRHFLSEANRCLRVGGLMIMIEPWVSSWSRLVYGHMHHEPFCPESPTWEFPSLGPLSSANAALPYVVFRRDLAQFQSEYPTLKLQSLQPMMPFRYLASGGVSTRALIPEWTYAAWVQLEACFDRWMDFLAMFAQIEIVRIEDGPSPGNGSGLPS
jgi:SAM-dependent methyltransferase